MEEQTANQISDLTDNASDIILITVGIVVFVAVIIKYIKNRKNKK